MDNRKLIAKNTLYLYIRMILVMCVTLFTTRVILKALGATDFGIYNVVGGIVVLFSFLNGALSGATSRFLAFELGKGDIPQLKKTFSASLNIYLLIAVFIFVAGELLGLYLISYQLVIPEERMNAAFWVLQFSLITAFFAFTQHPYTATLIAHENMSIYAYFGIYEAFSKLAIALAVIVSPIDNLIFYAMLIMLNQICILCFYRIYATRRYKECRLRLVKDKQLYKKLLSYTGYDMLPSMGFVLQDQGTNILLNMFFGPVANAARAVSTQAYSALYQMVNNVMQAARPQIVKSYARGDKDEMYNLTFLTMKYSYLLMLAIISPLFFEMDYIIYLWLGENAPNQTIIFCRIAVLTMLIQCLLYSLNLAMHAIGKLKLFSLTNSVLYLIPIILGYYLFKIGYPDYTILIIFLFVSIFVTLNTLFLLYKTEKFDFWRIIKNVFIICVIITVLVFAIPVIVHTFLPFGLIRVISSSILSEIILGILVWFIALDIKQRDFIKNKILKLMAQDR